MGSRIYIRDYLTGNLVPIIIFDDANGNSAAGHVLLSGMPPAPVSAANPMAVSIPGGALDGVDGQNILPPPGGSGIRGWLSGIYNTLSNAQTVSVSAALPAGSNNIGSVTLAAGASNIGTVGIASMPPLPAGSNTIGSVTLAPSAANIGVVTVGAPITLAASAAVIGTVVLNALPQLPTGSNVAGGVFLADPTTPSLRASIGPYHSLDGDVYLETSQALLVGSVPQLWNGTSMDRARSNSAAPTTMGRAAVASGSGAIAGFNAKVAAGSGSAVNLGTTHSTFGMQVSFTSNPTAVRVELQGSLDGTNWRRLALFDSTTGATSGDILFISGTPVTLIRAVLTTLTGGVGAAVSCIVSAA